MKSFRWWIALAVISLCAALPARAQGQQSMWSRAVSQLGLTTSQQAQLRPVFEAFDQQMQTLHQSCKTQIRAILTAQQQAALEQQRASGQGGPPRFESLGLSADQMAKINALHQQIGPQMEALRTSLSSQVGALLTAQQKTTFEQMLAAERPPQR